MSKPKVFGAGERQLRLLLVGGGERDFFDLRELLVEAGAERFRLSHAASAEDVLYPGGRGSYDLLFCSSQSSEDVAFQLLRQVREHDSCVPVFFLSNRLNRVVVRATIQAAVDQQAEQSDDPMRGRVLANLDLFDRASAARQHREPEETLRKLWCSVEQLADTVIVMDRSGAMEYVNPAFEALTGYSRQEAIGQTLEMLEPEQQTSELYSKMWETVFSGNVFRGIVMNRKKNGETLILEQVLTPLRDGNGQITHFISTGRDITERRKLESELQQAQKMDAIGRLAGGVAHDFNNLLLVISAYAELMLDGLGTEDPLRQNVAEIMTASRRAADLTRQLLAFGRKQMQLLQVLDLNRVIGEIATMLPRLIGEDIELVFVPEKNLGKVKADPIQIEQIVMNLAVNARDAMPDGGMLTIETATVQVDESYVQRHSMVPLGDYVLLTVADSGQGITAEHLPHIFEPFFTTKEAGKGTGLGLATVYGIVKQNGGFVWVYSEPGLGTTFKVYLPQVQSLSGEARTAKLAEECSGGCETVLLVEDEASVRQASREFLARSGYTVLEARDGEDALLVSRKHRGPIQLMVTDVVMPRMGGPRLAERLAEERPQMKVLFVSGYAENAALRHGKTDVSTRFLQKPFSLKTLARNVRDVLETTESCGLATASHG